MNSKAAYRMLDFTDQHIEIVKGWLRLAHVSKWFPNYHAEAESLTHSQVSAGQAMIYSGVKPIGYMRWQWIDKAELYEVGLKTVPAPAVDADLFIGEESFLRHGAGGFALSWLEAELVKRSGDTDGCGVRSIGLTTSVNNTHAHSAFEKAGFAYHQTYSVEGYGECYLFLKVIRTTG